MLRNPTSPLHVLRSFCHNRKLIRTLVHREVIGRYQGSFLGLIWSFLNPIFTLAVYTFVFSVVFKARWAGGSDSKAEFALVLFAGLMVFNLFSECMTKAPSLILSNISYVKKVVFPLEILPIVTLGAALFHTVISISVWIVFYWIFIAPPPMTILLAPIALLPIIFMCLGIGWLLASMGVFFRDISQVIGILTTILLFMSPIFYPISALPLDYQPFLNYNPLTPSIEMLRQVMIIGKPLDPIEFILYFVKSIVFAMICFAWFQKTRKGFADVL